MSALAQDFNVGAVQSGHYQRMDVTLTWDSEIPMEFRLHMWQPSADGEGVTVISSISRDLLMEAISDDMPDFDLPADNASVTRAIAGDVDRIYVWLAPDYERDSLAFKTPALAAFVRSSLAMCPTESEAVDVDGLITQIFHAEEAQ